MHQPHRTLSVQEEQSVADMHSLVVVAIGVVVDDDGVVVVVVVGEGAGVEHVSGSEDQKMHEP